MTFPAPVVSQASSRRVKAAIYPLLLAALTLLVFQGGVQHEFTNWDDWKYIVENPLVQGLSLDRIWIAFSRFHVFNYNPLHLVSYMLDHELWGLDAGGFFATNLLCHLGAGLLLYSFARRWIGSRGYGFLVAAFFLCHPTRVESVAWISERKDVLSALFALSSLVAYAKTLPSTQADLGGDRGAAGAAQQRRRPVGLCIVAWIFYLLALLSKSQLVTLPLVFVALDLHAGRRLRDALLSKAPHFALSLAFSFVTVLAHTREGTQGFQYPESILVPLAGLPRYLAHWVWPIGLSPYYDYTIQEFTAVSRVLLGSLILGGILVACWRSYCGRRVWFVAMVWFLCLLAPVSGFVRINILLADRYLYLSVVGPLLALSTTVFNSRWRRLAAVPAVVLLALCSLASAQYLSVFKTSEQLWRRVLEVSPGSSIAHSNYGAYLRENGRWEEAASQYDADLLERPYYEESFLGRAALHARVGENESAARLFETLLEKRPQSLLGRIEYANFLEKTGNPERALSVLIQLDPVLADAVFYCKLFDVLCKLGRREEARGALAEAQRLDPYEPRVRERIESLLRERP